MGFFSDLKDDLSQAVNELKPEEKLDVGLDGEKMSEGNAAQMSGDVITSQELSDMLDKVEAMSAENDVFSSGEDTTVWDKADELSLQEEIPAEVPIEPLSMDESLLTEGVQNELSLEEPGEPLFMEEALTETLNGLPLTEEVPVEPLMMDETLLTEEISAGSLDEPLLVDETFGESMDGIPSIDEIPSADEIPSTDIMSSIEIPPEVLEELPTEVSEDFMATDEMQVELPEDMVSMETMESDMPIEAINELREEVQEGMSEEIKEELLETNEVEQAQEGEEFEMDFQPTVATVATDETAVVTEGMSIIGDITSGGSLELLGAVTGNIDVLGKLNITGSVQGNSKAAEIFAEGARINGEINSQGSVKIGQSSVIIGNIFANSAVIAGAVKGDIDIHGPVVLDTSAIVMGNIKSKSVQINNGAVIEGMCSQCYAEVNPTSFFEEIKKKKDKK